MAETSSSQSRLTVLTGPLAGRELVLDEAVDNILIGSDEACRFHLPTPGVEPIHARLWMDASGVTVYETHSGRGLYVNDDRVNGQAPLRNGDILWLGTPGDDDVVMIQCRLPVRAAAAPPTPAPSIVVPEPEPDTDAEATMVIVSDSEADRPSQGAAPEDEGSGAVVFEPVSEEGPTIEPEGATLEAVGDDAPPPADFVIEETPAMAQPEEPSSGEFSAEEGFPFPPPPQAPHPAFEDETEAATLMMPDPAAEPTLAMPPTPEAEPAHVDPEADTLMAPPPPPAEPPPPPVPPPAHVAPPPTPRPAAAPPARPRPAPAPRPAHAPRPQKKAAGGGGMLYVVLGLIGLAIVGGGGFVAWRMMQKGGGPAPTPAPAAPTTMAAAPVTQPAITAPPETLPVAPPTTTAVEESVTVVKTPPPPSPSPAPSKAPASPTPAPTKATTPTTTVPAAPSAEALRGQQVATLLGQADAAAAARNYDQAAGLYDQVLRLEPENAKAGAGKTAAMAVVTSLRKSFVTGKTVVRGGKAAKGGPAGFDSEDVNLAKAPDYSGRIDFEVSPAHVKPGDAFTVHVFLTNDGKKSFKIGSLNMMTSTNGTKSGGPAAPAVKEVQPQQRVALQDFSGTWAEGTNSWNLEVDVVSDHGDSFKNQVTWR